MTPSEILVDRLVATYEWPNDDPQSAPFRRLTLEEVLGHRPVAAYLDDHSRIVDEAWHIGRVRFFYDELRAGRVLDPISIDNRCDRGHIYPEPILLDGHHRLAASVIAGSRTILAWYGGRLDLLAYLTGGRRTCPSD